MKNTISLKFNDIVALMVPLFVIFSPYRTNFTLINAGITLFMFVLFYSWIKTHKIYIDKYLLVFCVYSFIQMLFLLSINEISFKESMGLFLQRVIVTLILSQFSGNIFMDRVYKLYKVIALIAIIGLLYQSYQVYILGQSVKIITFLPVTVITNLYQRPMSIFEEPAGYATFMVLFLILNIKYKDYFFAIVTTITIVFSASTLGIVLIAAVWVIYIIKSSEMKKFWKIISTIFCAVAVIVFYTVDIFSAAASKLNASGTSFSDYLRLFKGLETFIQLPFGYKIIGIGMNTIGYFKSILDFTFKYAETITQINYQSTGFGVFVEFGIIGAFLYYLFFIKEFKKLDLKNNTTALTIFVVMVLLILSSTFFFNTTFLLYFLVFENINQDSEYRKKEDRFALSWHY